MEFKDYYKVMGLPRDATEAQIKQAYRKLARKYHPDVSKEKDAEERFKELGEAYEVLRNPEKRAAYDQLGAAPRPGEDWRPPPDFGAGFEFSEAGPGGGDYSDFFESLFGGGRRGARPGRRHDGRSEDHHARIMLDLAASLEGGARQIALRMPELDAEGRLMMRERTLSVQVPKGILAGQTIRLAGQGARLGDAPPGDLYLQVEFQPHPFYRLEGRNLSLDLPVAPWEAALGATVKCPTPAGPVDLKIPPGSHADTQLRLRGRGMPAQPPGDLYVRLKIALPPDINERAREAYRALAAAEPFNPRAQLGV